MGAGGWSDEEEQATALEPEEQEQPPDYDYGDYGGASLEDCMGGMGWQVRELLIPTRPPVRATSACIASRWAQRIHTCHALTSHTPCGTGGGGRGLG